MQSKVRNVAVLMGGATAEHEVSLASGRMVLSVLGDRHHLLPVKIDLTGQWLIPDRIYRPGELDLSVEDPFSTDNCRKTDAAGALARLRDANIQVAFLALHGASGEDGAMQGFLEIAGIPYTGSGIGPSALAMDKIWTREILAHHGVPIPQYSVSKREDWITSRENVLHQIEVRHTYPIVAKSPCFGSSIGMGMPANLAQLTLLLDELFEMDDRVLIESRLQGTEVTCAVIEDSLHGLQAFPPTEIVPIGAGFFDYEAKYTPGATEEITPARISPELVREVQETSLAVHRALRLGSVSRTDFILSGGVPVVLETNTIPGLTPTSLLPQGAAASGMSFSQLLERLLECALKTSNRTQKTPASLAV
ncbi:MAG: D-alanine--D-alanine ligase [Planctomycetota bacterium]|nr:D-alanine--D-alanine ligase [Planctomycetota bacterium]